MIRGSRLVGLDSRNHILRSDEPAFEHLLREVRRFLGTPVEVPRMPSAIG
jgi:hypothetical protein